MKKVVSFLTHPWFLATLGVAALSALVWWVGPLIGIGDKRPLEGTGVRLAVIGVLLALLLLRIVLGLWARKRANTALLEGMAQGPSAADREADKLNERFAQAIEMLKSSGEGKRSLFQRGQYLYELPWYVFIGAPGSGKTTALMNAGLTFPLAEKMGQASVKGVGGTRHCDWWFTDQAVLIDTAGRYTLQESDAEVDGAAWKTFLGLLKKARPRRPLNGVMLTVNVQDLLQQSPADRREHAAKLRARIQELHTELGVRPPVYVLVTKVDLLAGFNESFGGLAKDERDQVWGFTFPHDPEGRDEPLQGFGSEFAALEKRVRDRLLERMESEGDVLRRAAIFAFPQQFAGLKGLLGGFLESVFGEGGDLEERPVLRGVYFTSGTQEGTPIDRVLGTLARTFGVERRLNAPAAARGKSFFLHRLLKHVVFAEQGLVGENRLVEARRRRWRALGLAGLAVLSMVLVAGWALSFVNNKRYVAEVAERLPELKKTVATLPPAANGDVTPLPGVLGAVRDAARPSAFPLNDVPLSHGFGLFQGDKLDAGAQQAYHRLLDRAMMPRLARRLEERLRAVNQNNLELAYEALKGYLMLYTPDQFDPVALKAWIGLDWDVNLDRVITPEQREALDRDLDATLARGAPQPSVPMDKELVAQVRDMLKAYPLEYRVFSRLKRQNVADDLPGFSVAAAGGPNAARVFVRASGQPLTQGISPLFTREGYHNAFKGAVDKVVKQLAKEEGWVLGTRSSGLGSVQEQLQGRDSDMALRVRRLYLEEYIKVWDAYLADVRLAPMGNISQSLVIAQVLAAPDSPLSAYLRGVARETQLVQQAKAAPAAGTVADQLARQAERSKREMAALGGGEAARPSGTAAGPIEQMVDDHFAHIHRLVEGKPAPLDEVLKLFNEVYVQLSAVDAAQKSKTAPPAGGGGGGAAAAKAAAGLQPEPIKSMLTALAEAGDSQSRVAERQGLTAELKPITEFCARAIAGRYPFAPGSKADVLPDDFAQMFGVGGMVDDFYNRRLASLVDTGVSPWAFRPLPDGSKPGGGAALADFQRAARIKEVFFRGGGKVPAFRVDIRALELADGLKELDIDIDGQVLKFVPGNTAAVTVNWPPARLASQVKVSTQPAGSPLLFEGSWALFRLFDRFEVQPSAQPERFQVVMNLDGRKARLEVIASSAFNPFRLREVQQFRCPAAL
ncbi:MAG: type VI secretion system membrane subunit TssM [Aquabacterium commune]|uniref:type VI secretion system membrane subunit TssM n=1 Tax=Aquabacterium commune TaxID=70586 RepID=UPI003BB12FEC